MSESDEINSIFSSLNTLLLPSEKSNKMKAKEARDIFERIMKLKMKIPRNEIIKLSAIFYEYVEQFKPDKIKYSGNQLIKDLNRFSHDTPDDPSSKEIIDYISKLIVIAEIILEVKNSNFHEIINNEKFSDPYIKLNEGQKKAANSDSRITLVEAGPGTGKTFLITERLVKAASKHNEKLVIGLSFTNEAANNLQDKFNYRVLGTNLIRISQRVIIGTIHSFAFFIIKKYYNDFKKTNYDWMIIDEDELADIHNEFNFDINEENVYLNENKLLTFDGILRELLKYLTDPIEKIDFKSFFESTINEIIVDEAQDLSKIQYKIINEILCQCASIKFYLVGDSRQNIFSFNGGSIENLYSTISKDNITKFVLDQSYRCPNNILRFVNTFVFGDCINHKLFNPKIQENLPFLVECNNKEEEADTLSYIISQISNFSVESDESPDYNDLAILVPSSFYLDSIAESLNKQKIPFRLYGGETFLIDEIKYILNICKFIFYRKKHFYKYIFKFWDYKNDINENFNMEGLNRVLSDQRFSIKPGLANTLKFILNNLNNELSLQELLTRFVTFNGTNEIFNQEKELIIKDFSQVLKMRGINDFENFRRFFSKNDSDFSRFFFKTANIKCVMNIDHNFVTVSTIHSAKGKEWNYVFIPGLTNNVFPRFKRDLNEELKLFYVACSRAKFSLIMTRPKSYKIPKKHGGYYEFYNQARSVFIENCINNHIQLTSKEMLISDLSHE